MPAPASETIVISFLGGSIALSLLLAIIVTLIRVYWRTPSSPSPMPTSAMAASVPASAARDAIAEEQEEEEGETSRSLWRRIFRRKRRRRAHERDIEEALGRRREGLFSIGRRSRIGMLALSLQRDWIGAKLIVRHSEALTGGHGLSLITYKTTRRSYEVHECTDLLLLYFTLLDR